MDGNETPFIDMLMAFIGFFTDLKNEYAERKHLNKNIGMVWVLSLQRCTVAHKNFAVFFVCG